MTPTAASTPPPLLAVSGLGHRLGARTVFRRLDVTWPAPEVVCLRGPNGSGKTTLLKLLAGALSPDRGQVRVAGHDLASDPRHAAAQLAFVPDDCPVYPFLAAHEWLAFMASVHATDPADARRWVDGFALADHLGTRFGALSLGTARKFMLAAALATRVPVLILDEPTNGLDAASFDAFAEGLAQRRATGLVVLTCHDAEQQRQMGVRPVELADLEAA